MQPLLAERFAVRVSVRSAGRCLAGGSLTPHKPLRRAYGRDPVAVQCCLGGDYPAIVKQAKAENAEAHWGDQIGLRTDPQTDTSYGRRGQTPVIPRTGPRFRCNAMSTITNRGELSFMVFQENFNAAAFINLPRGCGGSATPRSYRVPSLRRSGLGLRVRTAPPGTTGRVRPGAPAAI